ncbi:MAG: acyltransferase family protein [Nocardioides sp.]
MSTTAETTKTTAARSSRDPFFDNAKMLLVTLVVVGHSWTLFPDAADSSPVYHFLYVWHVPAFVMVTGYLSRSFTFTRRNLHKLMTTVVVPYFVAETLLALFRTVFGGEHMTTLYISPHWPMWCLAVLFLWRLVTPLLNRVRFPLAWAVVASLVGGVVTTGVLDIPRFLGLMPFFVLGMTMTREQFDVLARPRVRVTAAVLLCLAFVAAVPLAGHVSKEWLYWRTGYADLGVTFLQGVALRSVLMVVAAALAVSVLALIPRSNRWFTPLGAASLVVYLFHGFFVKAAEYAGVPDLVEKDPITSFLLVSGAAVGVALLLAATPVARRLNAVIDPISTVSLETTGVIDPDHHRTVVTEQLAMSNHLHPTRPL